MASCERLGSVLGSSCPPQGAASPPALSLAPSSSAYCSSPRAERVFIGACAVPAPRSLSFGHSARQPLPASHCRRCRAQGQPRVQAQGGSLWTSASACSFPCRAVEGAGIRPGSIAWAGEDGQGHGQRGLLAPGRGRQRGQGCARLSLAKHSTGSAEVAEEASGVAAGAEAGTVGADGLGADGLAADAADGLPAVVDLSGVAEWELDFCSRPLLDERGKRVWELLVCDATRQLQYSEFFPSNKISSATLKAALLRVCDTLDAPKPQKIRFFRAQMQTIIAKACAELDIQAVPSQRCVTLLRWLEERLEEVYKKDPSFQAGAAPILQLEPPPPQDLPDTLRGEQWAFVQLPLSGILQESERVLDGEMFGSALSLDAIGLGDLPPTTMIPGVAVASLRATPLAAWTSALELATLRVDTSKACLLLSTGVSDTWRYAFYRKSPAADAEARAWEEAKRGCGGLHFLAVQRDLEEEECTGFWLLHDANPPTF